MTFRSASPLKIAVLVLAAIILAFLVFVLCLTQPRWGTPFANWSLKVWGPEDARVDSAHLKFPQITTVAARNVSVPGRMQVDDFEASANIFGFLPFVAWISKLEAANGSIQVGREESDDSKTDRTLSDYRKLINEIALTEIQVRFRREEGDDTLYIREASGSLHDGTVMVSAEGAGTKLEFDGRANTSSYSGLRGQLRMSGDNFADIADLAGLAAPDTPPFDLLMNIDFDSPVLHFEILPETRVGDSDLEGPVTIYLDQQTPNIDANLRSRELDADDLGIVFGIPIGVGSDETVGEAQKRARELYAQSDRLIPNVVIDFSRLDAVDGDVTYVAESVTDSVFDIRSLELDFTIEGRVVQANRLEASFEQGSVMAFATIDGTRSPAVTTAEGQLTDVSWENLSMAPYARGTAEGRFDVKTTGDGFRQAAHSMEGRAAVWSTNTEILALAVEGAALDIGEAITVLGEDPENRTYTTARCAALALNFENGIGTFSPAVVDTEDSLIFVEGTVDLGTEALKLSVRSEAKDASLGTLIGDVSIGGSLRNPEISAMSAATIAQFGITALLSSVSGGLAALPFIEPGMAKDAPCGALLARAESAGGGSAP